MVGVSSAMELPTPPTSRWPSPGAGASRRFMRARRTAADLRVAVPPIAGATTTMANWAAAYSGTRLCRFRFSP